MSFGHSVPNEQECLGRIESMNQQLLATVNAFIARTNQMYIAAGFGIPSGEFPPFIVALEQFNQAFTGYAATPHASVRSRLAAIQPDLQKAIGIYRQMYDQALDAEGKRVSIMAGVATHQTSVLMDANKTLREAFAAANKKWRTYFDG